MECDILLVDDEVDLLDLFGMYLGRLGCRIHKADGGQRALDILAQITPVLVVLDLAMPEVGGLEVLHAIRSDQRFNATKIAILTAVPVLLERDDHKLADAVLTKPITPRILEQSLRSLLFS